MQSPRLRRSRRHGFSLLELLIVASLCAILFTTGALAYRAVAQNQRRSSTFQEVALTVPVAANFFPGTTDSTIDSYTAPNFGRATLANQMRNLFYEDVESATAVFPLPRLGNINSFREGKHVIGEPVTTGRLPAAYDTPAKFLELLAVINPTRANVFRTYRGAPPDTVTVGANTTPLVNGSIFILQPAEFTYEIWVRAVWEIDYIPFTDTTVKTPAHPTGVPCVHASVRRYVDTVLTNFYDVVFRESTLADVGIPFVNFERSIRRNVIETPAGTISASNPPITPFKDADNQPFYLIWWPDPAMPKLRGTSLGTYANTTAPFYYRKHEGQTSFTFVVPQFPCY